MIRIRTLAPRRLAGMEMNLLRRREVRDSRFPAPTVQASPQPNHLGNRDLLNLMSVGKTSQMYSSYVLRLNRMILHPRAKHHGLRKRILLF